MSARSWVSSANVSDTDFPLENLPYGVFEHGGYDRIGVAIGDQILDLHACAEHGFLDPLPPEIVDACREPLLNTLMALGSVHWSALRERLRDLLGEGTENPQRIRPLLVPMSGAVMKLPATIGDFTDFFASSFHASNAGRLVRADRPLSANYKYVPLAYHCRASSIVASGAEVRRPHGQTKPVDVSPPGFGLSNSLDYELELGMFIGTANELGVPVPIGESDSHIFGYCLVNDWSARDLQSWESQPLGPFLGKNFATTISPWIVAAEALEPFRVPVFARPVGDPALLQYLRSERDQLRGAIDVTLEVYLASQKMRQGGTKPVRLACANARDLYWTPAQMVAHHTSNGCNLRPGDLLATGTVSGPSADAFGSLLERTENGGKPFELPSGEMRTFLEDGDEVTLRGYCEREGAARIGFGECRGRISPAI